MEIDLSGLNMRMARFSFSGSRKIRLIRQVQRLIAADIPLMRTFDVLYDMHSMHGTKPNRPEAMAIAEWRRKLRLGRPIAACMEGWLSPAENMILEAGERGGDLVKAFSEALHTSQTSASVRNTIIGGLIYPLVLTMALVGMLYGFATQIVPTFAAILPPEEWTGGAGRVYKVATFIRETLPIILGGVALALVVAMISLPRFTGPYRRYADRLPPWSIYKVIQGVSFLMSLKSFLKGGTPITDALRRMRQISSPYLREIIDRALRETDNGHNIGVALRRINRDFPEPEIINEISIYADLEGFPQNLAMLAEEWSVSATARVSAALKVINNAVLIMIALSVGYIASSMFELQDLIRSATN